VVKSKIFSSKEAGKGRSERLTLIPMGQTFTNSIGMSFNLITAGTLTLGSPLGQMGLSDLLT
jgi:hypothetical protein